MQLPSVPEWDPQILSCPKTLLVCSFKHTTLIVGCCGILPVKRAYAFVGIYTPSDSFSTPQEINVFLVTSFIFAFSLSCHVLARAVSFILLQSSLMSLSETVMFWYQSGDSALLKISFSDLVVPDNCTIHPCDFI